MNAVVAGSPRAAATGARARAVAVSCAGFTLLELLLSAAVMVVAVAAVHGLFVVGTRTQREQVARIAALRREDRVRDLLAEDLRGALLTGGTMAATLRGGSEGEGGAFPGFLELTTTTALTTSGVPGADLQRVEYRVERSSDGGEGGCLHRAVRRIILSPSYEDDPGPELIDGVAALEPAFYDGTQWLASWDSEMDTTNAPAAVRVRVLWAEADTGRRRTRPPLEVVVPWTTSPVVASAATNAPPPAEGEGPPS